MTIPDPNFGYDEAAQRWTYTEPDWVETRNIIRGSRAETEHWRALIERNYRASAWTRSDGPLEVAV